MKTTVIMAVAMLLSATAATAAPFQFADYGRFVTLTITDENDFTRNLLNGNLGQGIPYRSSWPRGIQKDPSDERFGHWPWARGEEWPYESRNPNSPWVALTGEWDHMYNMRHKGGHVVEFGEFPEPSTASPVPTPEPASMLLLGVGLIGLAGLQRKIRKE